MSRNAVLALLGGLALAALIWIGLTRFTEAPQSGDVDVAGRGAPAPITGEVAAGAGPQEEEEPPALFPLTSAVAELEAALAAAPYVRREEATGPALYMIGFRSCPACIEFKTNELQGLEAAGVDVRLITYARRDREGKERSKPGERAMAAEVALTRSYALHAQWMSLPPEEFYQTAELPPAAESTPERLAALEAGRAAVDALAAVVEANGEVMAVPAFFWQEGGAWRAMIGYDQAAFTAVRLGLGLPAGVNPSAP